MNPNAAMTGLGKTDFVTFPTEEGGVRFYWPDAENQLSIDVEPSGTIYIHTVDVAAGTFRDVEIPPGAETGTTGEAR